MNREGKFDRIVKAEVNPRLLRGSMYVEGDREVLDIPGRWGRVDAFGRGRVQVQSQRPRRPRRAKAGRSV